jgi:hypothetical protein
MVERPLVIDSSSTLIEAARSAGPRGDYRCASATKLPLENASCDLVIAFMTLQRCRRTDRGRQRDGPRPCRQRDCLHRRCSSAELVGQVRERIARQLVCHRRELPRRVRLHRRHRAQWSTNDVSQQAPAARSLQPGAGSVGLRHRIHPRASDPRGSRQSRPVSTVAAHPVVPACARAQAGVDWSNIRHSVGSPGTVRSRASPSTAPSCSDTGFTSNNGEVRHAAASSSHCSRQHFLPYRHFGQAALGLLTNAPLASSTTGTTSTSASSSCSVPAVNSVPLT